MTRTSHGPLASVAAVNAVAQRVGVGRRRPARSPTHRRRPQRRSNRPASRAMSDTRAPARDGQAGGLQPDPTRAPGDHDVCIGELGHATIVPRNPAISVASCSAGSRSSPAASRSAVAGLAPVSEAAHRRARRRSRCNRASSQVAVTGASAGATAVLRAADGRKVASRRRSTPPAACSSATWARARATSSASGNARAAPVTVTSPTDTPPQSLYSSPTPRPGLRLPDDSRRHPAVGQRHAARARPTAGPTPPSSSTRATTRRTPTATQPASRHRAAARLRHRRREPAGHRLLRRRVRLLRGAPVARRLRRDRDHRRAAVGRSTAPSAWSGISYPGHHPAVRRRRPARRTWPRSRRCRCSTTPTPRCTRAGSSTTASRSGGRRTVRPTPDPRPAREAARGGRASASRPVTRRAAPTRRCGCRLPTCSARSGPTPTATAPATDALAPATFVARHRRAGVPRRRLAGPGDRQPLREHAQQLLARHPDEGHADERRAPGLARARGALASGSSSSTSTWRSRIPSIPPADPRAGHDRPVPSVRAGRVAGTRPLHRTSPTTRRRCVPTKPSRGCGCCSTSGPAARRAARVLDDGAVVPAAGHRPRPRGTSAPTARSPIRHPSRRPRRPVPRTTRRRSRATDDDDRRRLRSRPTYDWKPVPAGKAVGVRHRAAHRRHRARRHRQRRPVGAGHDARRRLRGDDQRGASRRQGDLRAERLAARQPAGARRAGVDRAPPGADPRSGRRGAAAEGLADPGAGSAVPLRPRVPGRLAHPHRGAAARRQPAGVGVRRASSDRAPSPTDRARRALRRRSCCRWSAGVDVTHRAAGVQHAPRSAVPQLRSPREPEQLAQQSRRLRRRGLRGGRT